MLTGWFVAFAIVNGFISNQNLILAAPAGDGSNDSSTAIVIVLTDAPTTAEPASVQPNSDPQPGTTEPEAVSTNPPTTAQVHTKPPPAPTRPPPTTAAPTTTEAATTTVAPTTAAPSTVAPTTVAETTVAPVTTVQPTTVAPTTVAPTTTLAPTTTQAPTTTEVPFVCPTPTGVFPEETDCHLYWVCKKDVPEAKTCGKFFLFDSTKKRCVFPWGADTSKCIYVPKGPF